VKVGSGYLLDTNIVSETLRPLPRPQLVGWLEQQAGESQFVSVITVGELRRGATLLGQGARRTQLEHLLEFTIRSWFEERVLHVTQAVAERWGTLDAARQLAGRPLNIADGLIAATALAHDLTLVTRNIRDFETLGVRILNPWEGN
jgi:predicted nucleic acid-binding protein